MLKGKQLIFAQVPDAAQIARIEEGFSKMLNRPVRFEATSVDESLLGGFVALIDGVVYNNSCLCHLENISKHLKNDTVARVRMNYG